MDIIVIEEWGRLAAAQHLADHLWQDYTGGTR